MLWLQRLWALKGYLSYFFGAVKMLFRWERSVKNSASLLVKENLMVGQYDIGNTLEVIALGLALTGGVIAALGDDHKINLNDIPKFSATGALILPAVKDIALVPKEIMDIQPAELERIKDFIILNGKDVPGINEKWLVIASGALKMGLGLLEMLEGFKK